MLTAFGKALTSHPRFCKAHLGFPAADSPSDFLNFSVEFSMLGEVVCLYVQNYYGASYIIHD